MSFHRFFVGNVLDFLRPMPSGSVNCCVTSPPYLFLRDYSLPPVLWPEVEYVPMFGLPLIHVPAWKGQLGLEPTPETFVGHIVLIFREVRRILRKDGTLWLNLGDTYAGSRCGSNGDGLTGRHVVQSDQFIKSKRRGKRWGGGNIRVASLPAKNLIGVPWRVAFALQADGWYLRMDDIWDKVNCLPESVTDRPTRIHENVFLLTKSARYWYDKDAIAEAMQCPQDSTPEDLARAMSRRRATVPSPRQAARVPSKKTPLIRNARSIWRIPTASFEGAHFAVFPPELAEKCILAGCPAQVCSVCGKPYVREVVKTGHVNQREAAHVPGNRGSKTDSTGWAPVAMATDRFLPSCCCDGGLSVPGIVLDPFGGTGTVTWAAMKHNRDSVYNDLSSEYLDLALDRCGFSGPRLVDCHEYEVIRLNDSGTICGKEVVQG